MHRSSLVPRFLALLMLATACEGEQPSPLQDGCQPGYTACGTACVNLAGDGTNCGACGVACLAGQVCSGGLCGATCALAGQTACGNSCVDTAADPSHCGACGFVCAAGQACSGGVCTGGGTGGSGGATSGGGTGSGGDVPATGGTWTGGASSGGVPPAGGATTGGVPPTGGATTGGVPPAGGTSTGGTSTGGTSTGGTSTGGTSTGGNNGRIPAASASTLRGAAEGANPPLRIGAAISGSGLNDGGYRSVAAAEHNYVTPENEMKWDAVEPNAGQFSWSAGDNIVNFAVQNGMKVKGHALVWHSQLPGWMSSMSGAQAVEAAMRRHIQNVMGHFKDRVDTWDVVNEAVQTDSDTGVGNPRMRPSVFFNALGERYLDLAFQIAREQDSSARLYYNDFSIDALNDKADFTYQMVKGMVERGVPIDGVGFQMHIGPPNNEAGGADVAANLRRFADLGLDVLISEMDINRCGNQVTAEEQLTYYHDIVEACFQLPQCVAITFWGINDGRSWLNGFPAAGCNGQSSQSLLFTDQYQKKETYNQVMNALLGR